jgi:hypothetical protein
MLKKLAQCVGLIAQRIVECQATVAHQGEGGCGQDGLGEAPPRNVRGISLTRDDRRFANEDMEKSSAS